MVEPLQSKGWAVVTGANRGLGLEFTRQLLSRGYPAVACCRDTEHAKELHSLKDRYGDSLLLQSLDVSNSASIGACAEPLNQLKGGISILIHNAGIFAEGEAGRTPAERRWRSVAAAVAVAERLSTSCVTLSPALDMR